ncbi:MAG TPA: diguanylate cyclase [Planktothrix sp.]|jgi:diguanylate cyclase (GGDEF)-like protein
MAELKVVLVEETAGTFETLKDALKKAGCDVAVCQGGFDALDRLGSHGADLIVSSSSLPDLSGYQLSSLIKSNDRANKLPFVLIRGLQSDQDEFWKTASLPDLFLALEDLQQADEMAGRLKEMALKAKEQGWKASMVKNLLVPSRSFSSDNVINSYAGLLDDLLIERLVTRLARNMTALVEPKKRFVDAYFSSINQLFNPDILGIVIASPNAPWAAFQLAPGLNKDAFDQLLTKIQKQLQVMNDLQLDLRGDLNEENSGKGLGEFELLPVQSEKGGVGALIFASYQKKTFNATSKAFMSQLQLQMQPVVQLLLAKQEIEVLQSREAYRASIDPLTGLYNLEFLVGFLQQQLLFSFRQRLAVGMAIIDIDNFAGVNEEFGYEIGDVVISTIANRLLNVTRSSDLLARYGGDEFAVVLPNTDINGVKILGEKVRMEIEQLGFVKGPGRKGPRVTVSVGCSNFNMEDLNPETILRDAKIALQKAKEQGRNCVAIFNN